ncbi:MAG TPA: hypothetical protein VGH54_10285 [Mycobacterium sp.]|jgi:hypothetical protein|uniref:hypothetical protein n=1 Tax=Mycobacterium sp. TaxID=1785 RepID=UPI002F40354C
MRDTENWSGPALAAYIDRLSDATSVRSFLKSRGMDAAQYYKWARGQSPTLLQIRLVADQLGVTLGQLLLEMGWGTAEDFTVVKSAAVPPRPPSVSAAVTVLAENAEEEKLIRDFLVFLANIRAGGETIRVSVQPSTKSTKAKRSAS